MTGLALRRMLEAIPALIVVSILAFQFVIGRPIPTWVDADLWMAAYRHGMDWTGRKVVADLRQDQTGEARPRAHIDEGSAGPRGELSGQPLYRGMVDLAELPARHRGTLGHAPVPRKRSARARPQPSTDPPGQE